MKSYAVCPCCSNKLIHHISNHRDYWFCRRCWQEMPVFNMVVAKDIEIRDRVAEPSAHRQPRITASLSDLVLSDSGKLKTT